MSNEALSTVLYAVRDGIAHVTLNRPEARNALSAALMRDLTRALERAGAEAAYPDPAG